MVRSNGKKALITGVAGQDGSYLAELLIAKGYEVHGLVRPGGDKHVKQWRLKGTIDHDNFYLRFGDVCDPSFAVMVATENFDELYHLAAQSHVGDSFRTPELTISTNGLATVRLLEHLPPTTKMYYAASSEMFAQMQYGEMAGTEYPLTARSPYGISKIVGHNAAKIYRQRGLYVVSGISFNHESPRRGSDFVTQKICRGVNRFKKTGERFRLGNVEAYRDWHHAKDTVMGMMLALRQDAPRDYVFASGESHNVKWWLDNVCDYFNVRVDDVCTIENEFIKRPWDIDYLCGDTFVADHYLGWHGRQYAITRDVVEDMCEHAAKWSYDLG